MTHIPANRSPGRLRRWCVRAAFVVLVSPGLVVSGLAGAAAKPQTSPSGVHGAVNVTVWSIDSDGAYFQSIVSGAIGDFGPAISILPSGKVDPAHSSELELRLQHGTFRLDIHGMASKLRAETAHEPVYRSTCSDYFRVTAPVPVVTGSGTGRYRGLTGTLAMSLVINEVESPSCNGMSRQLIVLSGSGMMSKGG